MPKQLPPPNLETAVDNLRQIVEWLIASGAYPPSIVEAVKQACQSRS